MQRPSPPQLVTAGSSHPYPPSPVDALQAWLGQLPWPAWVSYGMTWVLLALAETLFKWADGTYLRGTLGCTLTTRKQVRP